MKTNKLNFLFLIFIILSISLGCNFLKNSTSDESAKTNGEGERTVSNSEDSKTDDIQIKIEDENSESVNNTTPDDDDEKEDGSGNRITAVKFAKGKTSRTYSEAVIRGTSDTYILAASGGQNMTVNISSTEDNGVFRVISPSGQYIGGTEDEGVTVFNGSLPASGKYKIVVTPTRGNATYKINFAVSAKERPDTQETSGGLTTTVKFRKGSTGASYSNAVIRGERNTYILEAGGGQFMSVSISSTEDNAGFDVVAPNGRTLASETTNWNGQLPVNGKYRIIVGGTRGNATYRINFAVR